MLLRKYTFLVFVFGLVVSINQPLKISFAQETVSYSEMELAELVVLSEKGLKRAQKKALKNRITNLMGEISLKDARNTDPSSWNKTSKSVFKKHLKDLEKAEKKRLKDIAKKEKAAKKARDKAFKEIDKVYEKTYASRSEFDSATTISGHTKSSFLIDPSKPRHWNLRVLYNDNRQYVIQFHGDLQYQKEDWIFYTRANLVGGAELKVNRFDSTVISCGGVLGCHYQEEVLIELPPQQLLAALSSGNNFRFRISGKRGGAIVMNIPNSYLYGFLKKVNDISGLFGALKLPEVKVGGGE